MLSNLQSKVEAIAEKYADLVDNRIQAAIDEKEVDSAAMTEINDGIRILNHAASTLERIARLQRGDDANGITIALPPPPQVQKVMRTAKEKRERVIELLENQLELLFEYSQKPGLYADVAQVSMAMAEIAKTIMSYNPIARR